MFRTEVTLCRTVRDLKGLFDILKGLSHVEDLVCQVILGWNHDNIGIVLSPYDVSLLEEVKLRKEGGSRSLLCTTVLLVVTNTSSRVRL
jgi:hypothetical protein